MTPDNYYEQQRKKDPMCSLPAAGCALVALGVIFAAEEAADWMQKTREARKLRREGFEPEYYECNDGTGAPITRVLPK